MNNIAKTKHISNSFPFITSAQACSCSNDGDEGLKVKVTLVNITSKNDYNSIPAGSNLNSIFKVKLTPWNGKKVTHFNSLDTLINKINDYYPNLEDFKIYTTQKPSIKNQEITATIFFANGTSTQLAITKFFWR